jgi:hypothetical protein
MPYVTTFERHGEKKGLLKGIEAMLDFRFGEPGLQLMPRIRELEDLDTVQAVLQAAKTAATLEEVQRLVTTGVRQPSQEPPA